MSIYVSYINICPFSEVCNVRFIEIFYYYRKCYVLLFSHKISISLFSILQCGECSFVLDINTFYNKYLIAYNMLLRKLSTHCYFVFNRDQFLLFPKKGNLSKKKKIIIIRSTALEPM